MLILAALTVAFAACSMVYELFLAQTLTSVLGGTNLRYALTIGLYITSMGFGALLLGPLGRVAAALRARLDELCAPSLSKARMRDATEAASPHRSADPAQGLGIPLEGLVLVELLLMSAGLLCIPYTLALDRLAPWSALGGAFGWVRTLGFHAPIVVIGVLSGLELPLLMRCAVRLRSQVTSRASPTSPTSQTPSATEAHFRWGFDPSTMAWDYVGTVLGALLFPLVLLPRWGVFGVASIAVFGNGAATIVAVVFLGRDRMLRRKGWLSALTLCFVIAAGFLFFYRGDVETMLVDRLYLAEPVP